MPFARVDEPTRNYVKLLQKKWLAAHSDVAPTVVNDEAADGTSTTYGGAVDYTNAANSPWRHDSTEVLVKAKTTLQTAVAAGGTSFFVRNPYGFAAGDVVTLTDGTNDEQVTLLKVKTNGSVLLTAGTTNAFGTGQHMLLFAADEANILGSGGGDLVGADGDPVQAQDMAMMLSHLQAQLQHTAALATDNAGTTTSIVMLGATFTANAEVGNLVTFEPLTVTEAIRSHTAKVLSNTATTLVFTEIRDANGVLLAALPAAPNTTGADGFVITPAFLDPYITQLADTTERVLSAFAITDTDPTQTLRPSGGSNHADSESIALAALHRYVEQVGGTLPEYGSIQLSWGDNIAAAILAGGVPVSGTEYVVAQEVPGNAATTVTLVTTGRQGDTHLPTGTVASPTLAVLVKGPFAANSPTATNTVAVDAVSITGRAGNVLTITGKDATVYPVGSKLLLRDAGNKRPNPQTIDKPAFMDYLFSAVGALEAYTLIT